MDADTTYHDELMQIMEGNWINQLFGRKPTRMLIAHLTMAPFMPHDKKKLMRNLEMSPTSLYRAINDLRKFNLIYSTSQTIAWRQDTKLCKILLWASIAASTELIEKKILKKLMDLKQCGFGDLI